MGLSSSKHKYQQPYHPSKIPTYGRGQGFMQNHGPGFIPPQMHGQGYGYMPQPGQFPPGFVPMGYSSLPQPLLSWPTQEKPRKRKSRKNREREPGGFRPSAHAPTQASHPPGPGFIPPNGGPVFPEPQVARSATTTRRAQTPFMRPSMDHDDEVRHTQGRATPHPQPGLGIRIQESTTGRSRHGHYAQTPGQPPPRPLYDRYRRGSNESLHDANIARVLEPLEPAQPGAFGPSDGRYRAPLNNPLPPPPRDIYEMSPYKALLNLPHTTELLANYGQSEPQLQPHFQSTTKETKKPKKGLFRAFSSRRSEENKEKETKVLYVPIVVPGNNSMAGGSAGRLPAMPPLGGPNPSDTLTRSFSVSNPPIPRPPSPAGSHVRDPPIRFNQDTVHAGFLNHSPYRVIYENKIYPTATHLLEALKFMPRRMDIVEQIRACTDVADVYPLSATLQQHARKDWAQVHLEQMLEVLHLKFTQHANLRSQLLETFDAELIYSDPTDPFWGEGTGGGANTYGRLLEQVRARLQEGRPTKRPRDT